MIQDCRRQSREYQRNDVHVTKIVFQRQLTLSIEHTDFLDTDDPEPNIQYS
jgi:hypothetical protein